MIVQGTILQTAARAVKAAACACAARSLDILMLTGAGYLISHVIAAALAGV
jgi:hypothetical protein